MSYGYGYGNPLDLNRDGVVSRQEFTTAGAAYGGTGGAIAATRIFDSLDTNRNGVLDQFDGARPRPALDLNRDGVVSRQEFTTAGAVYGGTGGAIAASQLFNTLDTNRNGVLDQFDGAGPRPPIISTPVVYTTTRYYPSCF